MPEPVTAPAEHKHGNLLGAAPRVRLCGGPFIDVNTMTDLKSWQKRGTSYGVAIDRLAKLAHTTGFDPVTETFAKQTKTATPFPPESKSKKTKNRTAPKS
jgi:hypothetical protein